MDWIKKHYDQFALAILALALLIFSIILILHAHGFGAGFSAATATAVTRDKVPPLVLVPIEEAKKTLEAPPQWDEPDSRQPRKGAPERKYGSLFVADRYVIGKEGAPKKTDQESFYNDTLTGQPIPNSWFIERNLPLLDPTVPFQDPDKDGFNNEDEWRGTEIAAPGTNPTDPNNKDSHPAYQTKLFVKQFIRVPFRLLFNAYDGDPKKDKIDKFSFQINTIDLRQPSEFLKIGEKVTNTKFKLEKFEYKSQLNPNTGEQEDVSELTITNVETDEKIILVLNRVTDSPDFFMRFIYEWTNPPIEFTVKKRGEFRLKPNVTEIYKLVDSQEGKGLIQTPDGKQIEIRPDPRVKK
jgi:hypothetical protein